MRKALTSFYDNFPGLASTLIIVAGLVLGGWLSYQPPEITGEVPVSGTTATPTTAAAPTQASIVVQTAVPDQAAITAFGTLVTPDNYIFFKDPDGFESAPLLDTEQNLYISSTAGRLYALDKLGNVRWETSLAASAVGDLILTQTGKIVAADRSGRLVAYDSEGKMVWEFFPEDGFNAVSGPALGQDGSLFYMLESDGTGYLQAVSPGGTARWQAAVPSTSYRITPWIYPGGDLVFVKSTAFDVQTGNPAQVELPFEVDAWITSSDGSAFLQNGTTISAWTIVDGIVTLPYDGPRFVIPDPGAIIRQALIDLNGISWIAYIGQTTDGIAWFNPDGSLKHQVTTGSVLLSIIAAVDDQDTIYACGPSPRQVSAEELGKRTSYCLAFKPGEEKPLWQKPLAAPGEFFVGSIRDGNEIYIASESGDLILLGRSKEAAAEENVISDAEAIPGGWLWHAPAPVVSYLELLPDGTLPLLLEDGSVFYLSPTGNLTGSLVLPEFRGVDALFQLPVFFHENGIVVVILLDRVYAMQTDKGQLWEFPVEIHEGGEESWQTPVLQHYSSAGVEYLLDSNQVLNAYTPEDGLLWSYALEEGLREDFSSPAISESGRLHIADANGTLYAFDAEGLAWSFDPGVNLKGASDPEIGPDGNLYYVTTSGTSGFLNAITPDGESLWQIKLETFRFYNRPQFASGGAYVRVADDFINTETGELLSIEFPFEVEQFIEGADGNDYILTGDHIIRWTIGPEGYEEVRSIVVNLQRSNDFIRPIVIVFPTGEIEIRIFDSEGSRFFWVNQETGETRSAERPWSVINHTLETIGPEFIHCDQNTESLDLLCVKEVPGNAEPVWSLTIQGIDGVVVGFPTPILYQNGRLFVIADGINVYMFEVTIP